VPENAVVTFKGVSFGYDTVRVLQDVNLTIKELDLACIVGPNGGGKTTLLKLILGLLRPKTGEVRVFGLPPVQARRRIGYMPQFSIFDPQFPATVMDIVLMGRVERRWGGPYRRADKKAALNALDQVGMMDLTGRLFNALSGGQRQRVLIARALASDPDLFLLDEPTANIDVVIESKLFEILKELNRRMTILLVTHDLSFVSNIVKNVICVNRTVVQHPITDMTGEVIRAVYGADTRLVLHENPHF